MKSYQTSDLDNRPAYSVVVPVYNSDESLPELSKRIEKTFRKIGQDYEVVFVDDGSRNPKTWPALLKISQENPKVTAIQLTKNYGKSGAVVCGLQHTSGDWVATIDDDLQQAPEDIPDLIAMAQHDVVVGFPTRRISPASDKIFSVIKSKFDSVILQTPDGVRMAPLKLIRRPIVDAMCSIATVRPFIPALIFSVTKDVVQVDVSHSKRSFGKSQFGLRRRLRQFSNLIFGNSSLVLRMVAMLGMLIASLSFIAGIYQLMRGLLGATGVAGWASLITVNLLLGGAILFSIGILGEYLIRIIESVENRPAFTVRQIVKSRQQSAADNDGRGAEREIQLEK